MRRKNKGLLQLPFTKGMEFKEYGICLYTPPPKKKKRREIKLDIVFTVADVGGRFKTTSLVFSPII